METMENARPALRLAPLVPMDWNAVHANRLNYCRAQSAKIIVMMGRMEIMVPVSLALLAVENAQL